MDNRPAREVDILDGAVVASALGFGFPKGCKLRSAALDADGEAPCLPCAKGFADDAGDHASISAILGFSIAVKMLMSVLRSTTGLNMYDTKPSTSPVVVGT
jgi:hypothetical protein